MCSATPRGLRARRGEFALPRQHQPDVRIMKDAEPYKKYGHGALATQIPNTMLTIYAMKIVGDGSNQTKTAAQTVPYLGDTDKGRPNFDAAAAEGDGRRGEGAGLAGLDPLQRRRRRSTSRSMRSRRLTAPIPTPASTGSSIARSRGPNRSSAWRSSACSRAS